MEIYKNIRKASIFSFLCGFSCIVMEIWKPFPSIGWFFNQVGLGIVVVMCTKLLCSKLTYNFTFSLTSENAQRDTHSKAYINKQGLNPSDVCIRSAGLGFTTSVGIAIISENASFPFGVYLTLLSIFHYSEFLVTSIISPETLSLDSFLLNHSREYGIAAVASLVEFFVELYIFPDLKGLYYVTILGLGLCIGGELFRKWSMLTASKNFTHLVRERKAEGQYLVKTGPYAICRHPGYAGWYWWSIGTQIVLVNPICIIGYIWAVTRFFSSRIYYEEICLLTFFGNEYVDYQNNVRGTGVPFVNGYGLSTLSEPSY